MSQQNINISSDNSQTNSINLDVDNDGIKLAVFNVPQFNNNWFKINNSSGQTYDYKIYNQNYIYSGYLLRPQIYNAHTAFERTYYDSWFRRSFGHYGILNQSSVHVNDLNQYGNPINYFLEIEHRDDGDASFSISGTAEVGETLSIREESADADGTGTLSYNWQTSSDNLTWSTVSRNATYTIGVDDRDGKSIRATISYQDAQGFNESVTTSITNTAFINDGDAAFGLIDTSDSSTIYNNETVKVGETIKTGLTGSDPDGSHRWQTESYSWQTSTDNLTWNEVATTSNYTIQSSDNDKSIRAVVSYTDNQKDRYNNHNRRS